MSDKRLRVFHAAAKHGSFTRAASLLNMTQPAVTFQIRQLEDDLNARLFDRRHNNISLTEAGRVAFDYAERIVMLYEEMSEQVKQITGDRSGSATLGASTTIAEYLIPALLGEFRAQFPEIQVRMRVGNTDAVVAMVEDNLIDLAIVEGYVTNKQLEVHACQLDELVVLLPPKHPAAEGECFSAQALLQEAYITREEGSGTRSVIEAYLQEQDIDPKRLDVAMELGSTEAIKGAVEAGLGVSIASRATALKEIRLGSLVALPLQPALQRQFWFVHRAQKFRSCLVSELFQFAKHYYSEHKYSVAMESE